ncbi:sigma-70 family RNA polymerase sigma factor [Enterococcus sp. 669A]|uniref:RNA polymerase sigma factor SigS n=1 Tax=Candidatus Enterococcus moelleringii TaxID=2815325 RepID=A0ABS3LDR5_9ENTE|nr:sigma-70 family RNA polymerase sigma factor [Enterococcus sp. 669A]
MLNQLNCLLEKAKSGDECSFKILFEEYQGVVFTIKKKYFIRIFDTDDWLQEGRIALNDAIMSYEQNQKVSFGLYFKIIFEHRIQGQLRKQEAKKRKVEKNIIPIDTVGLDSVSSTLFYHEYVDEALIMHETLENLEAQLSPFEAQVFMKYMKSVEISDIAKGLGRSPSSVSRSLSRAKRKIKNELSYQE